MHDMLHDVPDEALDLIVQHLNHNMEVYNVSASAEVIVTSSAGVVYAGNPVFI